jgi:hypothetical protein
MLDVLATFNCARGGPHSCCPFHNAVNQMQKTFQRLLQEECDPLWTPYTGAQCSSCYAMTDDLPLPEEICMSCGMQYREAPHAEQRVISQSITPDDDCSFSACSEDIREFLHIDETKLSL